ERRRFVVAVRLIEVDFVDLQAVERALDGAEDVVAGKAFVGGPHLETNLGGNDDLIAAARVLEPAADDRFRFAPLVAGRPAGVDVGGVDEVETGVDEAVKQFEGLRLVGGPAEDVATEGPGGDLDSRIAEGAFSHW